MTIPESPCECVSVCAHASRHAKGDVVTSADTQHTCSWRAALGFVKGLWVLDHVQGGGAGSVVTQLRRPLGSSCAVGASGRR